MKEQERFIAAGLTILLLVSWLGFLVHRSPNFAGSLTGGIFGIAGAVLMLVPLIYCVIKRIPPLRRAISRHVQMATLLTWHIYLGILGPILAIIHTGHKFMSLLGITLVSLMFIIVFSGLIVRYFMRYVSDSLQEKRSLLHKLEQHYRLLSGELQSHRDVQETLRPFSTFFGRLFGSFAYGHSAGALSLPQQVIAVSDSIADVEYAIRTHTVFERAFKVSLSLHIAVSLVFYGLLCAHIVGEVYYGLRWFQ